MLHILPIILIKIVNFIRFSLKMQCKPKEENLTSYQ